MMGTAICQRGRYPDGKKRRWTRAQKSAAKRARVEEWMSVARWWKKQNEKEIEERKSTTLTRGGVGKMGNGKWREELPWELWELILDNLSAVNRLSCVTSTKVMMERYEKGSDLATLREEAREEVQTVREECYEQRVEEAVGYYMIHNVKLKQPGVCYRSVARQFRIGKPDLREGVEIWRHGDDDEDSEKKNCGRRKVKIRDRKGKEGL